MDEYRNLFDSRKDLVSSILIVFGSLGLLFAIFIIYKYNIIGKIWDGLCMFCTCVVIVPVAVIIIGILILTGTITLPASVQNMIEEKTLEYINSHSI